MSVLYALLVGIDAYRAPVPALRGCRNDITAARAFLQARIDPSTKLSVRELCDDDATRAAVLDGFHSHLGQAGPGDTALFWFSGHGSYAPVPPQLWHLEPTGQLQTLLCVDSRHGDVPDLLDKELSILLDEVAGNGGHLAVVLDSCHSGGGTREPAARSRSVPGLTAPPPVDTLLPELLKRTATDTATRVEHIALAACRSFQTAQEMLLGGEQHGLFSWALLRVLRRLGPAATYRQLLTAARCEVESWAHHQVPQLYPVMGDLADRQFLGGKVLPPSAAMTMRHLNGDWEIDAGACHGLTSASDDGDTRVAVHGTQPVREARVTRVLTERSVVEPVGWRPDLNRQYDIVLSSVPMPATTVAVGGSPGDDATAARVLAALRTAGPGARPSPHLRPLDPHDTAHVPELRVATPEPGMIRILGADGIALCDDVPDVGGDGAERVVTTLEHIARWRQIKALANPLSGLADAVSIEVVAARPGDVMAPLHRPALRGDDDGAVRLTYRRTPTGWQPPTVFVRLRNRSARRLFCVLLDLTDRFRIHAGLFPGEYIGPNNVAAALVGRAVELTLPAGRLPVPGASGRDWLMLLVAEEQFNAAPFELPGVGEPMPASARAPMAINGVLDRLGRAAVYRDAGPADTAGAYDWTTTMVPIVTQVPADQ